MRIIALIPVILFSLFNLNTNAQIVLQNAFPNLGFSKPIDLQHAGDGTDRIFVVEQEGIIKVFPNSGSVASADTFLDLSNIVSTGSERGLLGLAFHPDYTNNGYFYVNFTIGGPTRTLISRFEVSYANPDSADENSEVNLITFNQPDTHHNGGWLGFGPNDGFLYIATRATVDMQETRMIMRKMSQIFLGTSSELMLTVWIVECNMQSH